MRGTDCRHSWYTTRVDSGSSRLPFDSHGPRRLARLSLTTHTAASRGLREISMYGLACAIFTQPGRLQYLADSRNNTQTPQRDVSGDLVNVQARVSHCVTAQLWGRRERPRQRRCSIWDSATRACAHCPLHQPTQTAQRIVLPIPPNLPTSPKPHQKAFCDPSAGLDGRCTIFALHVSPMHQRGPSGYV